MSGTVSSCRDAANRYFTERYPGYRLDNFRTEKGGFTTFYLSPLSDGVRARSAAPTASVFTITEARSFATGTLLPAA